MSVEEIFSEEELLDIKACAEEHETTIADLIHASVLENLVR